MAATGELILAFDYGARRIGVAVGQTHDRHGAARPAWSPVHGTPGLDGRRPLRARLVAGPAAGRPAL